MPCANSQQAPTVKVEYQRIHACPQASSERYRKSNRYLYRFGVVIQRTRGW